MGDERARAWRRLLAENAEQQARPYPPPPPAGIQPADAPRRWWRRPPPDEPPSLLRFLGRQNRGIVLILLVPAGLVGLVRALLLGRWAAALLMLGLIGLGAAVLAVFLLDLRDWREARRRWVSGEGGTGSRRPGRW